jgi:hypothetical protein
MNTAQLTDEFEVITEEYESVDEQQADKAFRRLLKRDVPEFLDQMSLLVSQVTKHLELSNTSLPFSLLTYFLPSFTSPLFISLLFI